MTLLFIVDQTFNVTGRGLILTPGMGDKYTPIGSRIKLIRPDKSVMETTIRGISFDQYRNIMVGEELTKEDVPAGTEVWLIDLI
jgi:hypothetical protein